MKQTAPKEKAKELVDKMWIYSLPNANGSWQNAKQCALIAVDEILSLFITECEDTIFWKKVKQELEKL
jgi:hypothetical protein